MQNPYDVSKWILPRYPDLSKADAHPSWLQADSVLNKKIHVNGVASFYVIPKDPKQKEVLLDASPKALIRNAKAAGRPMYVANFANPFC